MLGPAGLGERGPRCGVPRRMCGGTHSGRDTEYRLQVMSGFAQLHSQSTDIGLCIPSD